MTCRINKIGNANRGESEPRQFRDVLLGRVGAIQVGREGTRTVKLDDGTTNEIPNHMPVWDVTFSSPKSVSVMACVQENVEPKTKGGAK